jgi:hypothetical protein
MKWCLPLKVTRLVHGVTIVPRTRYAHARRVAPALPTTYPLPSHAREASIDVFPVGRGEDHPRRGEQFFRRLLGWDQP